MYSFKLITQFLKKIRWRRCRFHCTRFLLLIDHNIYIHTTACRHYNTYITTSFEFSVNRNTQLVHKLLKIIIKYFAYKKKKKKITSHFYYKKIKFQHRPITTIHILYTFINSNANLHTGVLHLRDLLSITRPIRIPSRKKVTRLAYTIIHRLRSFCARAPSTSNAKLLPTSGSKKSHRAHPRQHYGAWRMTASARRI